MTIKRILEKVKEGSISIEEAVKELKVLSIEEIDEISNFDLQRDIRTGIPEIIFGAPKTSEQIIIIIEKIITKKKVIVVSRLSEEKINKIENKISSDLVEVIVNRPAKCIIVKVKNYDIEKTGGHVGIIAAGTSDIPVAEEAKVIAETMGAETQVNIDVGIAGLHRLFPNLKKMIEWRVDVLIVVAGMEGALPTLISGIVDIPVIGVPTSTGYGFGGKGIGALTTMLQSCALGLAVVNIDNGIGAGSLAALIANNIAAVRSNKK
ncbi:MAG: nickel pincer cofactor biosynthesis protein LarB [Candidatus Ranarchaeia archaeon]